MKNSKFVCPMHPEIVSDSPGTCSKCGMELVEVSKEGNTSKKTNATHESSSQDHSHHHLMMAMDFKKRFFVTLPFTILTLLLSSQIQKWLGIRWEFSQKDLVLLVFGTLVVIYGAKPFFAAAKTELTSRNFGMMTLVSLALSVGYLFSLASTFYFPGQTLWWEISTLTSVFLFGHWLEMRAVVGTGGALGELAKLIPPIAHKVGKSAENLHDVPTAELKIGDIVLVKPGEKVPIDGVVLDGNSNLNESLITGESKPVFKQKGDKVVGGSVNNEGSLTIRVEKIGSQTALSQIMDLIKNAQSTKPAVQSLADKAANYLTLIAIGVGISTFVYWFFINPSGIVFSATLAISVIVITCPHALGLAIPTVTTITTSLAAKNGILIRDMKGIDVAKNIDYVIFDKTGTLTKGNFAVNGNVDSNLLATAAAVELHSQHPIAEAIVEEAKNRKIKIPTVSNFKSTTGKGVEGIVNGSKITIKKPGVSVYKNGKLLGNIEVEDELRPESQKTIKDLHNIGIKVAMLTGDKKEVGEKVGKQLGIDTIYSEVLPKDKVGKVRQMQKMGHKVAMVGDGINDAPALTQANIGIAIGAGTSVAIESAEIVLVKNNPLDVVKTIELSRATDSKMKQNLAWATGYNLLAIPAAAGVFFSWGIVLRPEWGALLMSASSVIVVANALLLRKTKL